MNLANPKMMDVAAPANPKIGLLQSGLEARGWSLNIVEGKAALGDDDMSLIDLRDRGERERHGAIAAVGHAANIDLARNLKSGGLLQEMVKASGKDFVFYCVLGERSAMSSLVDVRLAADWAATVPLAEILT